MINSSWQRKSISELAAPQKWSLNGGPFGSKLVSKMYVSKGVPVIRGCNLPQNARFDGSDFVYISEEKADELRQHQAVAGDLIITQRGTLGQVGIIPDDAAHARYVISQSQMKLTADRYKADPLFLYYLFRLPDVVKRIEDLALRSGVPHINLSILRTFEIEIPPLSDQHRIASILGAHDDLIEVNRRRIAILEEMARRLFEEWFVHFRFPGYENHKMIETPDGPIPEGWSTSRLGDLVNLLSRGIAPKYSVDGLSLVINQKCIRGQRLSLLEARTQSKIVPEEKQLRTGDILINSTGVGTLGRVAQVEDVPRGTTVDSHVTIVRAKEKLDRDFFGLALLRIEDVFERLGIGATGQTELSRGRIADQTIVEPSSGLQIQFGCLVRPIRRLASRLSQQNQNLNQSRDLLLPRLILGELSVASAEQELEAAAS